MTDTKLESHAALLVADQIDTDQIIPARFLKVTTKRGLGARLFNDWRYLAGGALNPDFVLNVEPSASARILVAGTDFGCGSSREHAPWALVDFGIRAVIARSFADIFRNNALKNRLLPIELDAAAHDEVVAAVRADPRAEISIDVQEELVTLPDGRRHTFTIEPFAKHCFCHGLDELGYLLSFEEEIARHESNH